MRRKKFEETDADYLRAVLGPGNRFLERLSIEVVVAVAVLLLLSLLFE